MHAHRSKVFMKKLCGFGTTPYLQIHVQLEKACAEEVNKVRSFFTSEIEVCFRKIAGDLKCIKQNRRAQHDSDRQAREAQTSVLETIRWGLADLEQLLEESGVTADNW